MGVACPNFRGENFISICKIAKFVKVFSLESFPLYSTYFSLTWSTSTNIVAKVISLEDPQHRVIVCPRIMSNEEFLVAREKLHQSRAGARTNNSGLLP